jgi:mono/diheme cytochrome c family protein
VLARDGDPVAGARVFEENCAVCHGSEGEGGEGPDLRDGDDTEDQLADKLLWGWGAMDGFSEILSVREMADVIAFVHQEIQRPAEP